MLSKSNLILAAAPTEMMAAQSFGLTLAHMAYRVGGGPHLFRANLPIPARGGLMMIDDAGFDGRGDPGPFCQEVMRECTARCYTGVICGFDRPFPLLGRVIAELSPLLERQGWPFYISELYARYSDTAKILIPTALSGGSLHQRLEEGMIDEVRLLIEQGIQPDDLIYYGLEYKYLTLYVIGKLTYEEMFTQLETAIHQFAKRQMTWFRGMERRGFTIHWMNARWPMEEKIAFVKKKLEG